MKATELMIGDWVQINGIPHKIQAIDSIDAEIQADDEVYYVGEDRYHSEDKVEGVSLTPEILWKNGFNFISNSDTTSVGSREWIYKGLEIDTSSLYREGKETYYINIYNSNIECEYVHQLQHALRLCGLNELADNFKL